MVSTQTAGVDLRSLFAAALAHDPGRRWASKARTEHAVRLGRVCDVAAFQGNNAHNGASGDCRRATVRIERSEPLIPNNRNQSIPGVDRALCSTGGPACSGPGRGSRPGPRCSPGTLPRWTVEAQRIANAANAGVDILPSTGAAWVQRDRNGSEVEFCGRLRLQWVVSCQSDGPKACDSLVWDRLFRVHMPCCQLDCHTCRHRVRNRRGRAGFQAIGGGPSVGFFVFPFPAIYRHYLTAKVLKALRAQLVALLIRHFGDWYGEELKHGLKVAFHPEGDKSPGVWKPHFHVQWPHLALDERTGETVQIEYMLPPEQLGDLRGAWGAILDDLALAIGARNAPSIVHYRFAKGDSPGTVYHHIAYDERPFPAWYAGDMPQWMKTPQRFGLLAPASKTLGIQGWRDAIRGDLADLDGTPEEAEAEEESPASHACPCCGGSLVLEAPLPISVGGRKWTELVDNGVPCLDEWEPGQPRPTTPEAEGALRVDPLAYGAQVRPDQPGNDLPY